MERDDSGRILRRLGLSEEAGAPCAADVAAERSHQFVAKALPLLGPLIDEMGLTDLQMRFAYTLLLAQMLSRYPPDEREAAIIQIDIRLKALADALEKRRRRQSSL